MINLALEKLRPNAKWQMTNNNYDELVWLDEEQSKPTKKEVEDEIFRLKAEQRIAQIKAKANELILARYSIIWQLNHPRTDVTYASDYAYIDNIRDISNEAEANGTALEDINWEVTNG